ncbi:MAG: hypothetical protein ACI8PZ_002059 [Myxococcota bacterium]|jgi:hypothetical protein
MRWSPILLAAAIALGGCRNSCQMICVRMAKVAEDDCGFTVPDDQLSACIERQKGGESKDDRAACREFGDIGSIRNEWTCDQLGEYWGADAAGGGGGGGNTAGSE